jgi:hypothetical protein
MNKLLRVFTDAWIKRPSVDWAKVGLALGRQES